MPRSIGTSRAVLLLLLPLTIPVLWIALRVPFKLLELALTGTLLPKLVHIAGLVLPLAGAVAIQVRMWRALKPSEDRDHGSG